MSTEQSVENHAVEEARQQLRNLVHEIEQVSRSSVEQSEFYEFFLGRVVNAMAAVAGAVWTLGNNGRLELAHQVNLQETRLAETEENQIRHGRLLRKLVDGGPPMVVAPLSSDGENAAGNPTNCMLVLGPLMSDQHIEGVLEIFQRPGASVPTQRGYLNFLLQMCGVAGEYLKVRRLRHFHERQNLWARLESFTRTAHQSLDPRATSYVIANEGRRLIECDRVSVAIVKGSKCRIEAVSGQEIFDKRSNTVTLLGRLATAVCATGDEVWYTGDTADMAPQVEETLQEYIDDSHSKTVAIIPLRRPLEDENDREAEPSPVIGALIVEQIEESRLAEGFRQRVTVVSDHSATALANALEHNDLFLMPLWRTLGKANWVLKARTLPKTIAAVAALLLGLIILAVFPADFELQGKGSVEPVVKREIFARVPGTVAELYAERGIVRAGQPLLKVDSTDVQTELLKLQGDLNSKYKERSAKEFALREKAVDRDRYSQLQGELESIKAQCVSLESQIALVKAEKVAYTTLSSPIDGEIITWQVRKKLESRPVEKGQVLMTVADLTQDWELEIRLPEERMGYISEAQNTLGEDLKVTYILATDPGAKHYGTVKEVHRSAEVHGEDGNVVLIRVKIDKKDLGEIRPGAGVTAKFYCGRRAVGFVWFHDVIAFVQTKLLFRL